MVKLKKLLALGVGAVMTASLFVGCSTDGLSLYNAIGKSQQVNSKETQTDISINVSATNLSQQEQQAMLTVLPIINSSKISILTKVNQNTDKTSGKVESDINLQVGTTPINASIWVNSDLTTDKPVINEFIKMPQLLTAKLPNQFQGKDYMVMDLDNMANVTGMPSINYAKIMEFGKEFQPKFLDFISKYSKQFNPGLNIVNKVDTESIVQSGVTQSVDVYQISLNDKSFKDLIRYTLTNFAQDQDAINFIKDYMLSSVALTGTSSDDIKSKQDKIQATFDNLKTQLPEMLTESNSVLDKIQNITILGQNGITIRYAVNSDGVIINEKANAQFVVDLPSLSKLGNNATVQSGNPTGIYTISLNSNSDIKNNTNTIINFPTVNSTNSFNYTDLIKSFTAQLPIKTGWNSIDGKWYYGDNNGSKKIGWLDANNKWYYLGSNGEMKTGWVLDGSKWYYLGSNGDMAANTTVGGYKVGSDGAWIK